MSGTKGTPERTRAFAPRGHGGRTIPGALDAQLMARGLTGNDLCRLTGLDEHTVRRARRGDKRIKNRTLLKIADALVRLPVLPMAAHLMGVQPPSGKRVA